MTINVDGIQMCCPWPVITGSYLCRRCQLAGNDTVVDFFINSGRYWLAECQWIGMSEATAELNAAMKSIVDGRYISWVLFDRYCSWWCAEAWNIVRTLRTSSLMRFTLLGVGLHFVSTLFLYFQFFSLASSFIMISSSFFFTKKIKLHCVGFFFTADLLEMICVKWQKPPSCVRSFPRLNPARLLSRFVGNCLGVNVSMVRGWITLMMPSN